MLPGIAFLFYFNLNLVGYSWTHWCQLQHIAMNLKILYDLFK
jgi:hypothetical protein